MIPSCFIKSVLKTNLLPALFVGIFSAVTLQAPKVAAQSGNFKAAIYEQASEVSGLIIQHGQDIGAIKDFYSPYNLNPKIEWQDKIYVLNSPEERQRLVEVHTDYLNKLKQLDFDNMSVYGKVDYILLKKDIDFDLGALKKEEDEYNKITKYIPYADDIYQLEKKRRRGTFLDGQQVALQLTSINKQLKDAIASFKKTESIDKPLATKGKNAVHGLQQRLKNVYDFYMGYDPMFTWWVPQPYKLLDSSLTTYAKLIDSKGKLITTQKPDSSGIKGVPIGREELVRQLKTEMISYTPEELISLANKEFAWCDKEMLKASREMGYGDNWKAALEKVKTSYVPAGHQPELILKLYNDAISFIKERDLITIPPLAEETWGMIMMTPERQLVNPFFTGGKEISISYPTNTMQENDKLMSMRGNNPYFSRGTVQHELIPGHNLQYFMNSRYKPYRSDFSTPFSVEGWSLYWELLLYDKGFAKTPEERIGMLFWRMHRCARIIFSLNYHMGNWAPQQCVDFLVDRVGHEKANAEGEVRRSFEGGYSPLYQIAYLVGGLELWGLKKELVDSGKMTFKQYHDAVMKENQIPIEMIRATLTNQPLTRDFTTSWKFYDFKN
ncbi:DUF885 family protein [Mucilaginibacter polytrichastri]|uniref:X-Pro dipeptidyl-peptidase n=1 Tax=Mucilaginibacter polytrichastri TaxID=1302689 RepID=A0A1Q5ZZR8_9SPHI|nr:DUF885 family protein [Mucilaginibacter polytrichastri]OKS87264.1 hypothetical protein RG47T_2723 [Mucilaginibacter polytrichastri]SFT18653.1 protein of unknown function [Mucilaginibacter polytrichastri]